MEQEPAKTPPIASPDTETAKNDGIPHHKVGCQCLLCTKTRARKAKGLPPKKEVEKAAKKRRKEMEDAKLALQASLQTQVVMGKVPDVSLASKVAGMGVRNGQRVASDNSFVQGALTRAGITEDSLATLAAEGMAAFTQKIITDDSGNIVDVVNMPDWRNRHAFWRDILMVKKLLGADADGGGLGSGGLIVITPDSAKVVRGHPPACVCDECKLAWEQKTAHLRRAAVQDYAIQKLTVDAQVDPPEPQDVVEEDDFGPVE